MELIDIHSHSRIKEEGVLKVENVTFHEYPLLLDSEKENRFFSLGIHPWEAENATDNDFILLKNLVLETNVRLIGECGFDKNRGGSFEKQLKVFEKHIEISEGTAKPLIIHCVGYFNELFNIKTHTHPTQRWIIHGFRGKPQLAEQALKLGFDISFGEKFNADTVKIVSLAQLFVETDESERSIRRIYASIAEIKQIKIEEINAGNLLLNC